MRSPKAAAVPVFMRKSLLISVLVQTACTGRSNEPTAYVAGWRNSVHDFTEIANNEPYAGGPGFLTLKRLQVRARLAETFSSAAKNLERVQTEFAERPCPSQAHRLRTATLAWMGLVVSDDRSYAEAILAEPTKDQVNRMLDIQLGAEQAAFQRVELEFKPLLPLLPYPSKAQVSAPKSLVGSGPTSRAVLDQKPSMPIQDPTQASPYARGQR